MTQPLTTPRRKLTREEEMVWPNLPLEMPSRDEVDPEPHAPLMPPFIGPRRKKPNRKLTPQEQRQLDEESMRRRCLGETYRQIALHLDIATSTAYARMKRHLYQQRKHFHENAADLRDFQLHTLKQILPIQIHNAMQGDKRAFTLVLQGFKHQHKLSLIPQSHRQGRVATHHVVRR